MQALALFCIRFYQQHLSPRKGFSCAYRVHTGKASCSALGYRAIRYWGVWRGLWVLRQRLINCGITHNRYCRKVQRQAGFIDSSCDLPCDAPNCDIPSCDIPSCDVPSCEHHACKKDAACDVCSDCSSCSMTDCGDWGRKKEHTKQQRRHILPKIQRNNASVNQSRNTH